MEFISNLLSILRLANDGDKLHLECLAALEKMMNIFQGADGEIENLSKLLEFTLAFVEHGYTSKHEKNNEGDQINKASGDKQIRNFETIRNNLFNLCFNFLTSNTFILQGNDSPLTLRLLKLLDKILLKCCSRTGDDNCHRYFEYLLVIFSVDVENIPNKCIVSTIDYMCEYLNHVDVINLSDQDHLLQRLIKVFQTYQEQVLAEIFLNLVPKLWEKSSNHSQLLCSLWGSCLKLLDPVVDVVASLNKCLFLVCGLSDLFFQSDHISESRKHFENILFWEGLRSGLISRDVLTRKRSLFILRKIWDFVQKEDFEMREKCGKNEKSQTSKTFWNDFILIIETLEETQFHLIQPVLKKINILFETSNSFGGQISCRLLPHYDWLLVIFKRMMEHDCVLVKRRGVCVFLSTLHFSSSNFSVMSKFFCDHLLNTLQDFSLYHKSDEKEMTERTQDDPSLYDVTEALKLFFQSIDLCGDDLIFFVTFLLSAISSRSWNGPVLFNLLKCMDCMKQENFIGIVDILPTFKILFSKTVLAFDTRIKDLTRHTLAILMTHFIDPKCVNPGDIISLASVIPSGCKFLTWKAFIDWLSKCIRSEEAGFEVNLNNTFKKHLEEIIKSPCLSLDGRYDLDEFTSESQCSTIVRAILLVDKALEVKFAGQDSLPMRNKFNLNVLQPLADILNQLTGHAYLSEFKVHWVFMMLLTFVKNLEGELHQKKNNLASLIYGIVSDSTEAILIFSSRKFIQKGHSYSAIRIYLEVMRACFCLHDNMKIFPGSSVFGELFDWSVENLGKSYSSGKTSCIHVVSMEIISMVIGTMNNPSSPHSKLLLDFLVSGRTPGVRPLENFEPSFICPKKMYVLRNHVLNAQLTMELWLLSKKLSLSSERICEFVESCIECGSVETCMMCCQVMKILLQDVHSSKAAELISLTWKKVMEFSKKMKFMECFVSFVSSTFQLELMDPVDDERELLTCTIVGVAFDILKMADERPLLLNALVKTICDQVEKDRVARLMPFVSFLSRVVVFGPIPDRAARFRYDLLKKHRLDWSSSEDNFVTEEHSARSTLLKFLLTLRPINHEQSLFGFSLLDELMANYKQTLARSSNCYGNSVLHRCKHRQMVAMFALENFMEAKKGAVVKLLMEVPVLENQPSVRFLSSWLLMRLIGDVDSKYFQLLLQIFDEADGDKMKKPSLVTSMFHVISHVVSKSLKSNGAAQKQTLEAINKYMDILLVWSTLPQSSARISAQAAILFLSKVFRKDPSFMTSSSSYHSILNFNNFMTKNRSTYRHAFQLLESIYYKFDPWVDVSMEAIAHYVPLLTGLSSDECLDIQVFNPLLEVSIPVELHKERRLVWNECFMAGNLWKDNPTNNNNNIYLSKVNNSNNNICVDNNKGNDSFANTNDITTFQPSTLTTHKDLSDNVQKKITPWKDLLLSSGGADGSVMKRDTGNDSCSLILIASLVDRIPNLGGLCRTCEIFGVSKMVVGNMKIIGDVNFEKLSVTAHKWLDIEEVPVKDLAPYLSGLAREGYAVVALEQTSKSIPLQEFNFPKKCAVVLGNERSGIPVEIIQLMGACLEIPQNGVIRSLNVHVSGALLIWEYFKQTSLKASIEFQSPVNQTMHD